MEEFKYLIPEESGIVVSMDVEKLREVEGNLRDVFTRHQYKELILPMFEYVDLFKTTRHQKEESMFQFMNRDGKRIALRADFTVPIARLYHNKPFEASIINALSILLCILTMPTIILIYLYFA